MSEDHIKNYSSSYIAKLSCLVQYTYEVQHIQ